MDKVMSIEEKVKRAEEIYYRRRNQEIPDNEITKKEIVNNKKNFKLLKKMIKQIFICIVIYSIFYMIINNSYIFSKDFTDKVRELLSQDINFTEIYTNFLNSMKNDEKIKEEIQNNNENIGGAEEVLIEEQIIEDIDTCEKEIIQTEEEPILSQMEQDANYIKSTISFIKPVNGNISSMFGLRNPTTATVPKNHTGTDIAATTGTKIVSATDGTVIFAETKGDFGKHIKIQINDVTIVYAHCNELYVKEGDVIKQGQEIAEVGSTGNTTGPHLHFEIRYQDRCVDPQLILEL